MKKWLILFMVLTLLLCACGAETPPATEPPTAAPTTPPTVAPTTPPTVAPTAEPTVAPTAAPTAEPTTASAEEPDPPRREGKRLTARELDSYNRLFAPRGTPYARDPENYYNQALCFTFSDPRTIRLNAFFCDGFGSDWREPLNDLEYAFLEDQLGDLHYSGDIHRLPKKQVEEVLYYYFGLTMEDMEEHAVRGLYYFEDTDAYYFDPPGALFYGRVEFIDGYVDEETDTVWLYYIHVTGLGKEEEYVVTLQSKVGLYEYGYHILSNLPVNE